MSLKAKLPPTAIMTRAQKEAAEEYADRLVKNGLSMIIPQLENIMIIAAVDSGLKQRTTQRIINHYEMLLAEYSDDLITDQELATEKTKRARQQRQIETECD